MTSDGRRAEVEGSAGRLLDGEAVHHRVGERDADLDRVGAGLGDRPDDVEPSRTETTGDVRHEQLGPGVAAGAQVGFETHRAPIMRSARR